MSQEIIDVIYNHELFPKIFTFNNNKTITKDDLNINNYIVEAYRNSNEKIILDYERFKQTLKNILLDENIDNFLQIRAIILIIMLKNCIDATTIFEILLDEDSNLFNSNSSIFNDIFFNELSKNPLLVLDLVEIIKSFIKKNSLDYEAVYPIINKIILANENSKTPVDSNQLIFMDESDIKPEHKEKIQKSYPIILPFKLKYKEYLNYDATRNRYKINVNRDKVLNSVWLLDDLSIFNFRLKVSFGEGEVDAGIGKEFIDLAFKAIVLPETDLFELRNGNYWFKYHRTMTNDLRKKYRSFGILLGIAIINKITIPIHFPRYFYRKLLHRDINVSDLNIFDPEYFSSIIALLENEINKELDFSYVDTIGGYEIDLTNFSYVDDPENFEPALLTDQNKADFISKVAQWVFDISVKESFAAFEEGFRKVNINPMLYNSFLIDEIDKIVSGDRVIDWNALKQSAIYSGYTKDSEVIKWFWQYFDALANDKKFEVLKFITGTTSIPTNGLKDCHIKFKKGKRVFPLAHICFPMIVLPEYNSYNELERRCSEAFPSSYFGFG